MLLQWSFAVAEKANFKERGHYTTSPDSLYSLIQIPKLADFLSRRLPFNAQTLDHAWNQIQREMRSAPGEVNPFASHSSAVVVVDDQGNVASILHSINALL